MDTLSRLDRQCIAVTRRLALVAVLGMLILAALTTVDVILRGVANSPIYGFVEAAELIMAVTIAACFPAGLAERRHITIELLKRPLGARGAEVFTAVGAFFMLTFFVILCWRFAIFAQETAVQHGRLLLLEWPTAPFWWAVTGFLALCLPAQAVVFLIHLRRAMAALQPGWRPVPDPNAPPHEREAMEARPGWSLTASIAVVGLVAVMVLALWPFLSETRLAQAMPGGKTALAVVIFFAMWVFALLLVPLGAAMGLMGLVGTAAVVGLEPGLAALANNGSAIFANLNLAVIPLFLMMGSFAAHAGLAADIYGLAHALLRHRPGGLAMATVGGCAGFGAVTGSSVATVATIGRVAFPEMQKRGYSAQLATGSIAAGGTLGSLVPPSGVMVLYAILTEESIGQMFVAALIPAVLAVAFYFIVIYSQAKLVPGAAETSDRATGGEILQAVVRCWAVFILFGVVIGGLYIGAFTASEAAAIGAGGAFLLALLRGRLRGGAFWQVMGETAATSAMIYFLIVGGSTFSFFIGLTQLPEAMTEFLEHLEVAPIVVVIILLAVFVLLGAVMDPHGILVITVPIVAPLIQALGYDLIWWGIIMVVVVEIGVVTPPVGINVFVMKGVAPDVPLGTVFRGVMPFVAADIFRLAVLVAFPILVLYLPLSMR